MSEKKPKGLFTCGTPVIINGKVMTKLADPATFNQKITPVSQELQERLDAMVEEAYQALKKKYSDNDQNNPTTQ